jgi:O-antigen/teichoic acid export membrane protein
MILQLFLRNILSNYVLIAVTGLVGFVLTPLLFHHLKPANFAVLAFALTVCAVLEALDFGTFNSLVRFVSHLATREEYPELRCLVSTVFYLMLGVGLSGTFVLVILSPSIERYFQLHTTTSGPGWRVLAIVGLSAAFQLPATALRGHLMGCQDFHLSNAVDISSQMLRALVIFLLLRAGFGLVPISAAFPLIALVRLAGLLAAARWATIPLTPRLSHVSLLSLQRIRSFASLSFVEDTATRWYCQADVLLAAKLLPLPELAILSVARRIPWALTQFALQPFWVAYPMVSAASARADHNALRKFLVISTRNLLAVVLPLASALFIWGEEILRLWVGMEAISGATVFRILLLFSVFASLQEAPLTLLYGQGQIDLSAGLSIGMLTAAIGIGAWACSRNGLSGLAIAFAAIQILGTSLLCWNALKVAGLPSHVWLSRAVVPAVVATLPAAAWFLISYQLLPRNIIGVVISTLVGMTLFFGLFVGLVTGWKSQGWQSRFKRLLLEIE